MYKILAWLLALPLYLLSLLPLRVHYLFADILSWLLRDVFKYRRDVIETNLEGAFPRMGGPERVRIARDYYSWLGDLVVEIIWSLTRSGEHIRRRGFYRIDADSERVLNRAYESGRSVMALLAHTGNWELASNVPCYMAQPAFGRKDMTVAYQQPHSRLADELFLILRRARLHSPDSIVASHKVLRFMLEKKNERRVYFFLSDQYPIMGAPKANTFLGLETQWTLGGEAIARKMALPVLYIYLDREKRGRYVIKISQICSDASQMAPGEITDAYAAALERDILSRKYNWLWSHRRWKNLWPYNCRKEKK